MNEFLTAYLRALHTLRRGRLTPADAMDHVIDLISTAQDTRTAVGNLVGLGRLGSGDGPRKDASEGDRHA